MAKAKFKNEVEKLRSELSQFDKEGLLKNPNESLRERLMNLINEKINLFGARQEQTFKNYFKTNFRRNFLSYKRDELLKHNVGLSRFRLNNLNIKFSEMFKLANFNSLMLIKTQNDENMQKLKNRFVDWITLRTQGLDKKSILEMTKVPRQEKRVRFILKDQTNKMISNFDNIVASENNAIALQWCIRKDNKVTGKPGGPNKPSKNHGNHWARRDKFYYIPASRMKAKLNISKFAGTIDDLKDGLPGQPIGCRCYAKYYYELSDLPKELVKEEFRDAI